LNAESWVWNPLVYPLTDRSLAPAARFERAVLSRLLNRQMGLPIPLRRIVSLGVAVSAYQDAFVEFSGDSSPRLSYSRCRDSKLFISIRMMKV
jgi:hypothetical protein